MDDYIKCDVCGKVFCKKGIGSHKWRMHGDGIGFDPYKNKEHKAWNKGLTKETDERVFRNAESLKKTVGRQKLPIEEIIDDDGKLFQKWQNKRVNAKKENLECKLSYLEYCMLVVYAGLKSSDLGFSGGGYVLGRYGDIGDYTFDNCRFITQKENAIEKMKHLKNGI